MMTNHQMAAPEDAHDYGGPWTQIKLDAIALYLQRFTAALIPKGFDLWYVDAFAGTGDRRVIKTVGGDLIDGTPHQTIAETHQGSALQALSISPAFQHFIFIEQDKTRCAALKKYTSQHVGKDIRIIEADGNTTLCELVRGQPWIRKNKSKTRGVVFLDPYSLQVEWETLRALASTQCLDVWYLFPLEAINRVLARQIAKTDQNAKLLDTLLTSAWRELYTIPQNIQPDLLSTESNSEQIRQGSIKALEAWIQSRLKTEFPYVSQPLPLLRSQNRQLFSLFLCVANPNNSAINLAKKFAADVHKRYGPMASHQK